MPKPSKSPRSSKPSHRWWLVPLGIGIAGAALYALVLGGRGLPVAGGPPPLDHIDDASRARLERVLQEAESESAGR